jgi:ABC-type Fe3+-hydroxamate transport system substrate-binding protein
MRIISLVPSITETLYELGLEDQIVGITRFCTEPANRVQSQTKVGGTKDPNLPRILELKPDVVIVNIDENRKEDAEFLKSHGVRLLVTFPNLIQESIEMLEQFGMEFSVESHARSICDEIRSKMDFHPPARKNSLALIWRNPYMTAAPGTYVHHICSFFGFDIGVTGSEPRYPEMSTDAIKTLDPEVVLFPDEPYVFQPRHMDEFRRRFPQISAVRNNKLALFNGQYLTWFGYGTLRALREFPRIAKENQLWM